MRLGVFGGTFDPVHLGHLILAERCREHARLDRVLFIPAARPPHKLDRPTTAFHHRAEMIELAVAGNAAFAVDRLEEDRSGPSFTVDTLQALVERDPGSELFLIVGSDTLADLPQWYRPARILELATLLVVMRPGSPALPADPIRAMLQLPAFAPLRIEQVPMPLLEIASRELRARHGAGLSIRYEVPRAVEMYIREKGLYAPAAGGGRTPDA